MFDDTLIFTLSLLCVPGNLMQSINFIFSLPILKLSKRLVAVFDVLILLKKIKLLYSRKFHQSSPILSSTATLFFHINLLLYRLDNFYFVVYVYLLTFFFFWKLRNELYIYNLGFTHCVISHLRLKNLGRRTTTLKYFH